MRMLRSPDNQSVSIFKQDGDKFRKTGDRPHITTPYPDPCEYVTASPVPSSSLTRVPVSGTNDREMRLKDKTTQGFLPDTANKQTTSYRRDNRNVKWITNPNDSPFAYESYDQTSSVKGEPSVPPAVNDWNTGRLQSDIRHRYVPPDPGDFSRHAASIPRPMEPVQSQYVEERSCFTLPAIPNAKNGVDYDQMDQARMRVPTRQQFDAELLRQDMQMVRQEKSSKKLTAPLYTTCTLPPVNSMCNVSGIHNRMDTVQDERPLSEVELDEKRMQLMAKRKGKSKNGKKHKKKKEKNVASEIEDTRGQIEQEAPQRFVPHRPRAPYNDKVNTGESYSKRKRRLIGMVPNIEDEDSASTSGSSSYAPSINQGERGSKRYFGPGSLNKVDESNNKSISHSPFIPRQTSQQTMCWNSDTAKRGLGFKSKLRLDEESKSKTNSQTSNMTPEVRQKWKNATFY